MTLNATSIGIGVLAGVASAVMAAAPFSGALVLFVLSPLPILVAGLGWGGMAGVVAAVVCAFVAAAMTSANGAMVVLLAIAAPAALGGWLANLARPAEEMGGPAGKLVWFPLSDIVFYMALAVAAGFIVLGMLIGYGPETGAQLAAQFVEMMRQADPQAALPDDAEIVIARTLTALIPPIQAANGLFMMLANFYLASQLVRLFGQAVRPRDDWPTALRMPRPALIAFAAALLASFAAGGLGHAGAAVAGTLAAGFIAAGVAMLHARLRGRPARTPLLVLAYMALVFFAFIIPFFLIAGMLDTRRRAAVSGGPGPQPPNS